MHQLISVSQTYLKVGTIIILSLQKGKGKTKWLRAKHSAKQLTYVNLCHPPYYTAS